MQELPKELQKLIKTSKISPEHISPENFELLLNVLHFQTKLKFKSIEDKKRQLKHDHSKLSVSPPKTASPRPTSNIGI